MHLSSFYCLNVFNFRLLIGNTKHIIKNEFGMTKIIFCNQNNWGFRLSFTLKIYTFLALFSILFSTEIIANTYEVSSQNEFRLVLKKILPGDTIVLNNGICANE